MYKLLFDSDALIKISKSDFLDTIVDVFEVFITEDVYNETVKEGKKGFYKDADKIEKIVQDGKIKILKADSYRKKKKPEQSFGKGETSVYQAYKKSILIISDDLSFTSYIQKENIKSLSSGHLIFVLVKKGRLRKNESYYFLERLKPFIRKEIYELIKKDIGGK